MPSPYLCVGECANYQEVDAQREKAEARVAELERERDLDRGVMSTFSGRVEELQREVAWLRFGGFAATMRTDWNYLGRTFVAHLASNPPEGWRP